ncbi:hypothetical protein ACIBBE_45640 [Streptomyces sp. NPDC051644]|uniref:hypothetical protein n=1 Tax=Streptomyces sp. NPDC051644 TaxID=3365666 RepID=UPI0037A3BE12
MAWSLVKVMLGYSSADLDRIKAEGTAGIYEERSEIERRWVPATRLPALASSPLHQPCPFLQPGADGLITGPTPVGHAEAAVEQAQHSAPATRS